MRVGQLLCRLMPGEPEVLGLQALMLLNHSRRNARLNSDGDMVLLPEQNRELWDRTEIERGLALLRRGGQSWQCRSVLAAGRDRGRTHPNANRRDN
jgi:RNA polymerase sigma-70 factor (ECF subfamily)